MSSHSAAADNENVLSFDEAMAQFGAMFPHLGTSVIETVLRDCEGDVSKTIDELLRRSGQGEGKSFAEENGKKGTEQRKETGEGGERDPCANDEKIALLIQNREFLRYLRRDPNFQREMLGRPHASNHRHGNSSRRTRRHCSSSRIPHLSEMPVLLTSSHCSHSPNTFRFFRTSAGVSQAEAVGHIPDGPPVEFRTSENELAIPEGPLIDYVDAEDHRSSAGWAQRLKAKFTGAKKPSSPADYQLLNTSPLAAFSDDEIRSQIGKMDKRGKGLLLGLARKFGQMRTND